MILTDDLGALRRRVDRRAFLGQAGAGLGLRSSLPALALTAVQVPAGWRSRLLKVRDVMRGFVGSFQLWLRRPAVLAVSLGFTWFHMLCLFTEIWLLLRGMGGAPVITTVAGLWSLSYFVTLTPISINGLGLRELSVTYIFSELGGIPMQTALTLALILRTLDLLMSLPGAILIPTLPSGPKPEPEARD